MSNLASSDPQPSVATTNQLPARPKVSGRRARRRDTLFGVGLAVVIVLVITLYLGQEHAFYYWDYSGYQTIAQNLAAVAQQSPLSLPQEIYSSFSQAYNSLFALPLVPFLLLLGGSRLAFLLSVGLVYLLPYFLSIGLIATRLVEGHQRAVFWAAVGIAALTPATWGGVLRGYPDVGAAVLVNLAIWLYLGDPQLKKPRQLIIMGVLLALTALFRRHFLYDVTSFLVVAGGLAGFNFLREIRQLGERPAALGRLLRQARQLILLVGVFGLVLCIIGFPFVQQLFTTNFNTLYASYVRSWSDVLGWLGWSYGWLAFLLVLAGFGLAWRFKLLKTAQSAAFVGLFGLVGVVQWAGLVSQVRVQYTLHFTMVVTIGLVLLGWVLWAKRAAWWGKAGLGALSLYLLANFCTGLTPLDHNPDQFAPRPWASAVEPMNRPDYEQVVGLVNYLYKVTAPGDPIYLISASDLMNADLLHHADLSAGQGQLNLEYPPEIDSRDFYPLEDLINAKYVVVVDPFQYQYGLQPSQQGVVRAGYDMFTQQTGFAQDFSKLDQSFQLDGATATVYKRTRPTTLPTVLATLHALQTVYTSRPPGSQPAWLLAEPSNTRLQLTNSSDKKATLSVQAGETGFYHLLYVLPRPVQLNLNGKLSMRGQNCQPAGLNVALVDEQGRALVSQAVQPTATGDFSVSLKDVPQAVALQVEIASAPANCGWQLELGLR